MGADEKPKALGIIGAASKFAGASTGAVALSCKKAVRFLTGMPLNRPLPELEPQPVAEAPALESRGDEEVGGRVAAPEGSPAEAHREMETARGGAAETESLLAGPPKDAAESVEAEEQIAALGSGLADAQRELTQAREKAEEAQAQLRSQLNAFQAEKESLLAELTNAQEAVSDASDREGVLRARIAALEPDLAEAPREQEKASDAAAENEALRAELEDAQKALSDASDREDVLRARIGALESDLAEAQRRLEKAHDAAAERESLLAEPRDAQMSAEARDRIAALESGLADARRELTEALDEATRVQSRLESQLADADIPEATAEATTSREPAALAPDAEAEAAGDARRTRPTVEDSGPPSGGVTPEEVEAATFAGVAEKVMFSRALSDMGSADEATRVEAARMLGGIRHELTVRAIAGWFAREPAAGVRKECVKALTRLGLEEVLPVVERALADAAASVRLAAVHAIYRLAGPGSAITLVPVLRDENEDVRRRAATCIGWLGEKRLAGDLVPLLADRSAAVRCAALEAMENLRSRQVVTRVIELLDDPEESVRQKAFGALGAITGKRIANTLPEDGESRQRLIASWRARWEEESRIAGTE